MDLRNFTFPNHDARIAYLEHLANEEAAKQELIEEYRDYYDGDHDVLLSDRQQEILNHTGNRFRFNACEVVVESLIERLGVSGFEPIGGDAPAETSDEAAPAAQPALVDFAADIWESNRMDAGQEEIYRQAAIDQTTYVVLDVDEMVGQITLNHHDTYTREAAEGVKLHYPTNKKRGRPIFATKRWAITQGPEAGYRRYFVEYWPWEIRRYYQDDREPSGKESGWKPDRAKDGPLAGVWPIPWVDADGAPLGLPVIEFRNGRKSELTEVTPLQRALNKSVVDLVAAADAAGFGLLFAGGWIPTNDGKPITLDAKGTVTSGNQPLRIGPGGILYTENPNGTLTRIEATDLSKLIQVVDRWTLAIAQASRTPLTNFQLFNQIPGADTQQQLEGGLLAKAESRQRTYGNAWEDVIYMAARMATSAPVFDGGRIVGHGLAAYERFGDLTGRLSTIWKDAQTRNEKEHLETLQIKKQLGVPEEQIYLEMGYEQSQATRWAAESEARAVATAGLPFELNGASNGTNQTA